MRRSRQEFRVAKTPKHLELIIRRRKPKVNLKRGIKMKGSSGQKMKRISSIKREDWMRDVHMVLLMARIVLSALSFCCKV